jgi:hypothetical protein
MRAALAEAEKALTGMNDHMKMSMGMMYRMQNMHGMMGSQESKPQAEKTPRQ